MKNRAVGLKDRAVVSLLSLTLLSLSLPAEAGLFSFLFKGRDTRVEVGVGPGVNVQVETGKDQSGEKPDDSGNSDSGSSDVDVDVNVGGGIDVQVDVGGSSSLNCEVKELKKCRRRWLPRFIRRWFGLSDKVCRMVRRRVCKPGDGQSTPPPQDDGGQTPPSDDGSGTPPPSDDGQDAPPPQEEPKQEEPKTDDTTADGGAQFTATDLEGYLSGSGFIGGDWKVIAPAEERGKYKDGKIKTAEGHNGIACAKVSVNQTAQAMYPEDGAAAERVFEKGAVLVKDPMTAGGTDTLLAMKKVSREAGDWIFAEIEIQGQTATIKSQGKDGALAQCMNCHRQYEDYDFVPTVNLWQNLKKKTGDKVFESCEAAE